MNIFEIPKTHFISHRGFTPLAPENSLPSFYYAGLLGQWAIETDLHITKDGAIFKNADSPSLTAFRFALSTRKISKI